MATQGTDLVCLVCGKRPPPTTDQIDELGEGYEFYSEKTYESPPPLVVAINITKEEGNR